uniref:Uncharacterized protein n=1 Tax=Yersinia enterocolitica W22703 TaxID=913028 RepID=F4N488_YEREN|nr:unknown protein [Yersinia enterocolitica W22703]
MLQQMAITSEIEKYSGNLLTLFRSQSCHKFYFSGSHSQN